MKKLIYLLLLIPIVFSCEKEEIIGPSATVNLKLHANFNGEPLVLGKAYTYPDGRKIKFDEFSFFIAGVLLQEAESDDELDLLEVGLADFSGSTTQATPATFSIRSVPAVKYDAVRLSIGVPSKFNKSSILDFGQGHPVRQAYDSHFWPAGGSFYFMKLNGVYDTNGDGTLDANAGDRVFEHYPVKNANYTTFTIEKDFTVENGKPLDLDLEVDILKLYEEAATGNALDFSKTENLSTINPINDVLSAFLMGNFKRALTAE